MITKKARQLSGAGDFGPDHSGALKKALREQPQRLLFKEQVASDRDFTAALLCHDHYRRPGWHGGVKIGPARGRVLKG